MGAKVAAFVITLLVNIAVGVVVFFFMLVAMNGFSESDANYGLATYIVLALTVSLGMSILAAALVHLLLKREFRSFVATLIAVPVFSLVGAGLKIACSIIGIMVAEYVRVNY